MALVKLQISKSVEGVSKRTFTSGTNYLFNTKLIVKFAQTDDGYSWFWYNERDGRREKLIRFRYDGSKNALWTAIKNAEADVNQTFLLTTVTRISEPGLVMGGKPKHIPAYSKYNFRVDDIIKVTPDEDDSNYSWIYMKEAPFEVIVYKVPHTLDELNSAESDSGSLS